jgi:hypothetical protein
MEGEAKEHAWRPLCLWAAMTLMALAVAYPLSAGPANWAATHDYLPYPVYARIYRPVITGIFSLSDWARDACADYLHWWSGEDPFI